MHPARMATELYGVAFEFLLVVALSTEEMPCLSVATAVSWAAPQKPDVCVQRKPHHKYTSIQTYPCSARYCL